MSTTEADLVYTSLVNFAREAHIALRPDDPRGIKLSAGLSGVHSLGRTIERLEFEVRSLKAELKKLRGY